MLYPVLRPTGRHLVVAFAIFACGLGRFGGAAWAGEVRDEPETVAPVQFGAVTPVKPLDSLAVVAPGSLAVVVPNSPKGVSPNSLRFVAPAKSKSTGAVGFNLSNVARDVALNQIKAGTLTLEAAWQSGALTFDNIADLLEHPADPWIINMRRVDSGLHHQLIALLLEHESARLKKLSEVPQYVRLWLADYYEERHNPKCVEVAQSVLREYTVPLLGENPIVFQAAERLAWFYRDNGEYQLGGQVWLKFLNTTKPVDWEIIHAAWDFRSMGLESEEGKFWGILAQSDNRSNREVGSVGQIKILLRQGKAQEARAQIQSLDFGDSPEQSRIKQWSLLALSYYSEGEFDVASSWAHKALDAYRSLKTGWTNSGMGYDFTADENLLGYIEKWKKSPIYCEPSQIDLELTSEYEGDMISQIIEVKTFKKQQLSIFVDNPNVRANLTNLLTRDLEVVQEVKIEVPTKLLTQDLSATLTLTSKEHPDFKFQIPITIRDERN